MDWSAEWESRRKKAGLVLAIQSTEVMKQLEPNAGATCEGISDGYAVFHGHNAALNCAKDIGSTGPVNESVVDEFERFYVTRREVPRIRIDVDRTHESLRSILLQRGYKRGELIRTFQRALPGAPLPTEPEDIEIAVVALKDAEDWARVVALGFGTEGGAQTETGISQRLRDIFITLGFNSCTKAFIASRSGERVGGGAVAIHDEMAFLGTASTLPQHQKTGVHTALIAARLKLAMAAGCKFAFATAQASSKSEANIRRLGFAPFSESYQMYK